MMSLFNGDFHPPSRDEGAVLIDWETGVDWKFDFSFLSTFLEVHVLVCLHFGFHLYAHMFLLQVYLWYKHYPSPWFVSIGLIMSMLIYVLGNYTSLFCGIQKFRR